MQTVEHLKCINNIITKLYQFTAQYFRACAHHSSLEWCCAWFDNASFHSLESSNSRYHISFYFWHPLGCERILFRSALDTISLMKAEWCDSITVDYSISFHSWNLHNFASRWARCNHPALPPPSPIPLPPHIAISFILFSAFGQCTSAEQRNTCIFATKNAFQYLFIFSISRRIVGHGENPCTSNGPQKLCIQMNM